MHTRLPAFVGILFIFLLLPITSYSAMDWLEWDARLEASAQKVSGLPADRDFTTDLRAMHNNAFLNLSAAMPSGMFSANALLNLEQIYTDDSVFTKDEINFNVLNANAVYNSRFLTLTLGRFFYGEQNTLRPYYGLYENFLFSSGSSLDGGLLEFKSRFVDASLFAGAENKSSFAEDNRGDIYGAHLTFKPFKIFKLGAEYDMFKREGDLGEEKPSVLSTFAQLTFFEKTKIYAEYAKNSGKANINVDSSCVNCPDAFDYEGSALLVKLSDFGESKYGAYDVHLLYVQSSGDKMNHYEDFYPDNSFIYLGSIFTGISFMKNFTYGGAQTGVTPGAIGNLNAYNLGGSLTISFLKDLKLGVDFYSYSITDSFLSSQDWGTEIDLSASITPVNNLSLSAAYAMLEPGAGMKEALLPSVIDTVKQFSVFASYRF